jgi:hypothetical protein
MIRQAEQAPDVRLVDPDASDEEEEDEEEQDEEDEEEAPTGGLRGNFSRAQREYFAERLRFFVMIFFVITKETQNLRNFP